MTGECIDRRIADDALHRSFKFGCVCPELLPSRTLAFENRGQEFRFDYWVSDLGASTCTSMLLEKTSSEMARIGKLLDVDDIR